MSKVTVEGPPMSAVPTDRKAAPSYENHQIYLHAPGTICEGSYDFHSENHSDLSFNKGDLITIIKVTQDQNWYKAKNETGQTGMVPANYIRKHEPTPVNSTPSHKEVKLHAMPWFHGKITRQDAEKLMSSLANGLFLVRESTNYPGDYTMCVCFDKNVEHYRIIFKNNKVTIDEEVYFENLSKLVEHYQYDADGLVCKLGSPLKKKGGLEFSVDTEDFEKAGWTIKKDELTLGSILGKGDFGDVYEGKYKGKKVAVKSVKDRSKAAQSFLAEASVMTALNHKNLIKLLGVMIPRSSTNEPIYVVLEFMTKGALLEYLRSRGRTIVKPVNLLDFARDIADGMAYLEKKKLVHRDLAARNILISDDDTAKVSDFGLARDSSFNLQGGKFPVKWTAPEALKESKFSNKSDVWSYGITLWEMWSFGRVPYPRVPVKDLLAKIMKGHRMTAPEGCDPNVYKLMQRCWLQNPVERPSFRDILVQTKEVRKTLSQTY